MRHSLKRYLAVLCLTTVVFWPLPAETQEAGSPSPSVTLIPAGIFLMGGSEGRPDDQPVLVYVAAFYMDLYEVTKALWDEVASWAQANGYDIHPSDGRGTGPSHPVTHVDWYQAVKWCNARSEREGLTPAYYTSSAKTTVYRTGKMNVQTDWVRWTTGYRLPTEAEWEKAARGGLTEKRYPWGDEIDCTMANYGNCMGSTAVVGRFAPNGYGLHDMAGNVWEWCWDWHAAELPAGSNPRGPLSGRYRAFRGGSWYSDAHSCRAANRYFTRPDYAVPYLGFRTVLSPTR